MTDGDTITLMDVNHRQHKIRLDGIDSPESGQPFGRASKRHLAELLANRNVLAECGKTDRYGREACLVLVGGSTRPQNAPLLHRSSAAPHPTLPQPTPAVFLRLDFRHWPITTLTLRSSGALAEVVRP